MSTRDDSHPDMNGALPPPFAVLDARISAHDIAIRENRGDLQALHRLREADVIQHKGDLEGAKAVFQENTSAVQRLEKRLEPVIAAHTQLGIARKLFLSLGAAGGILAGALKVYEVWKGH